MSYSLKSKQEASDKCQLLNGTLPLPTSMDDEQSLSSIVHDHSLGIWVQTRKEYGYFNFTSTTGDEDYVGILRNYSPVLRNQSVCWFNFNMKKLVRLY